MTNKGFFRGRLFPGLVGVWMLTGYSLEWGRILVTLTRWVFFLILLGWRPQWAALYIIILLSLFLLLVLTFRSKRFIRFYIFFESSLIPTILLILGWGYQPERLSSSLYFLFYTLFSSLPLLFVILINIDAYSSSVLIFWGEGGVIKDKIIFYLVVASFLVKLPIYFVHIWLPKAHVEAPVTGSIILAAVLLKLGGYGLFLVQPLFHCNSNLLVSLRIVGGGLSCLICLRQCDVKALIAYSSVAHMSLVVLGIMVIRVYSNLGSIYVILSHGLCSSGLFYMSFLFYTRLSTRRFLLTRRVISFAPFLSFWWIGLTFFNMGLPPSFNFFSEMYIFIRVVILDWSSAVLCGVLCFLSSCYCAYLYSGTGHGEALFQSSWLGDDLKEHLVRSFHVIGLLACILA